MGYSLEAVAIATDSIPNYLKSFFKIYCQPTVLSKHFVCPVELRGCCVVALCGKVGASDQNLFQTFLFKDVTDSQPCEFNNRYNGMTGDRNGGLQNPPVIKLSTVFADEKFDQDPGLYITCPPLLQPEGL
jgi:hypothetical protein